MSSGRPGTANAESGGHSLEAGHFARLSGAALFGTALVQLVAEMRALTPARGVGHLESARPSRRPQPRDRSAEITRKRKSSSRAHAGLAAACLEQRCRWLRRRVSAIPEVYAHSATRGVQDVVVPRRIRSSSSASSPRIVLPACLDAQVANVHQFAPTPVRRATACASRQRSARPAQVPVPPACRKNLGCGGENGALRAGCFLGAVAQRCLKFAL